MINKFPHVTALRGLSNKLPEAFQKHQKTPKSTAKTQNHSTGGYICDMGRFINHVPQHGKLESSHVQACISNEKARRTHQKALPSHQKLMKCSKHQYKALRTSEKRSAGPASLRKPSKSIKKHPKALQKRRIIALADTPVTWGDLLIMSHNSAN
jgi:site-specific recombinase XerD